MVKLPQSASPLWPLLMALSMGSLCLGGYCYSPHPLPRSCFVASHLAFVKVRYVRNSSAHGCSSWVIGEVVTLVVLTTCMVPPPGKCFGAVGMGKIVISFRSVILILVVVTVSAALPLLPYAG